MPNAIIAAECAANMVGESPAFLIMMRLVRQVACCDAPVLVEGETGTGKELVARAIHYLGARNGGCFVAVNCGAIPDTLVECELFGHHKGAFTDAKESRPGLIRQAHGGTLFLDEIEALSPKGQVTLLRFLQDQQYRPVGGLEEQNGDVRIIAASNANLQKLADSGAFRLDLLFRLKILALELPPLRNRMGDAELLSRHYIHKYSINYGKAPKELHPETVDWLNSYCWPGNVRELENLIHREVLLADNPIIHFSKKVGHADRRNCPDRRIGHLLNRDFNEAKAKMVEDFEKKYLSYIISKTRGNVTLAAKLAGKERRALGKLLKKHGIDKALHLPGE